MSLSAGCPSGFAPPKPDSCLAGTVDGVDRVDLQFAGYATGGQGATMMIVRIAVAGANPPACLQQQTVVEEIDFPSQAHFRLGGSDVPLNTYAQPDGSRLTHDLYIVLNGSPSYLNAEHVTTTVGTHRAELLLGDTDMAVRVPVDLGGHD